MTAYPYDRLNPESSDPRHGHSSRQGHLISHDPCTGAVEDECSPVFTPYESESGPGWRTNADVKEDETSECNSFDDHVDRFDSDEIGVDDAARAQTRRMGVPADEMLSDDYYEQDGDDQSDSFHYKEPRSSSAVNSRAQSKPVTLNTNHRKSRSTKAAYGYDFDEDEDADYEDGDENDEDDPDDADFEPDNSFSRGPLGNKDGDWAADDSDDNDNIEDELEPSDEEYEYYSKKSHHRGRGASCRNAKLQRARKQFLQSGSKRRISVSSDMEELSLKESDNDTDGGFRSSMRSGVYMPKENRVRSASFASTSGWANEPRTSTRTVRKVSYAESEESGEDEEKKKKIQKELDEEDLDSIEKVLWHQPKGMAEDALRCNRSTEPVMISHLFNSELDWTEMEFFVKWKGQSHLHCQWKSFSELQTLSGFKKVLNYAKKVAKDIRHRKSSSREEIEVIDVSKEMDLDIIKQNCQVERIVAARNGKENTDAVTSEYLVKWRGLSYAETTWENDTDIVFAQASIDEYKAMEAESFVDGKSVDFQRKKSKGSLRKLDEQPEWLKGGQLRDYQLDGLNFLVNSWRNDTNVILADEMGLGKTVQSVSMLGFLQITQQIYGPFLVVVPLSTLSNWAKEFRKWLPEMNIIVYVGTRASREVCQQYEFYTHKKTGRSMKFNTLLTTYEVVLKDKAVLSKIKWNYVMVDEAHRLKNSEAQLYTTLSEFSTKNKLLITGTPLQNSVEELWALLHFLDPDKFANKEDFVQNYKNLSSFNEIELANLHKELRPHILRRVIKDVEKSLPPKIERILRIEMSPLQKQYYKWILERNFHDLNKGVSGNQVSLLNIVVELKKCCNHPFLFESADHGYGGDANTMGGKLERITLSSGKLVILDKLLVRLHETKHRVLIFSQMVRMLDILAEYMSLKGFQCQRLDGSTKAELRQQAMDHFNAPESDDFCFLLSTRAGGLGINLATADTVIIFDSDWNPQNDLQAMSRAHRIGQREVVNIYRFVTSRSVEEDILERAKMKMVLDHLVIQKLNAEGRIEKKEAKRASYFDKNELSAILRFGAEDLFKDDRSDEENKRRLLSMDIDEILERAEKVEDKEVRGGEEGRELLNAFKVANFGTVEEDGSFWSRLIKPEIISQLDETLAPRAARNTKSYAEADHHHHHHRPCPSNMKRKKRGVEFQERIHKRHKPMDYSVHTTPMIEGAIGQVRGWVHGNLPKRDALRFSRAVKKFGIPSLIGAIAADVGGAVDAAPYEAQLELFNALVDGCKEAVEGETCASKGPVLDFFGVPVKANDLLSRVEELQLLAKRVVRYSDPISQFRVLMYLKPSNWSKGCGWNQIDDARLLLGVHYHGFGNWEKIRLDERLGLMRKIAPVELQHHETFLPRAPNLNERASSLLQLEVVVASGNASSVPKAGAASMKKEAVKRATTRSVTNCGGRKGMPATNHQQQQGREKPPSKTTEATALVKEEGEMSGNEELYEQFKETKWKEWCEDMMEDEMPTLQRLHRLQTTSDDLPKAKVLFKIRKYLQLLGRRIDGIVLQNERDPVKQRRMRTRLWNHVSMFSNLSGERLHQIYSKLKQEHSGERAGPSAEASSHRHSNNNGNNNNNSSSSNDPSNAGKFEVWKRRRRFDPEAGGVRASSRSVYVPSSWGILGSAPPPGNKHPANDWNFRMRRSFRSRQQQGF